MSFLGKARQSITNLVIELPARISGMDRLIDQLENSGVAIEKRAAGAGGRANNRETLAHVVGIERWGQQRLRVALGEPLVLDEYDTYRPEGDWPELVQSFRQTRQETISLIKSIRMARLDLGTCIRHNQFGEISLLGWIFYLKFHANLESLKIH